TTLVRRADSPLERVRDVMYRDFLTTLSSIGDEGFRTVVINAEDGRVGLIEGGARLYRRGWGPAVEAMRAVITETAEDLVYARVRRVDDPGLAMSPEAYGGERPYYRLDAFAREDHLAPDAFAVQLLGPRYRGRFPSDAQWRETEIAGGRVLLEHA